VIDPVATGAAAPAAAPRGSASSKDSDAAVSRGFEQLLVQQLAKELLKTAGDTGNEYASLLPDALASAVEDGGGLGFDLKAPGS
jgi:hypothetical protein